MTEVANLGFRTDIALGMQQGAVVADHGDHLVVTTPANPGFYWGNFLLVRTDFDRAERWVERFHAAHPQARHVAIGLDTDDDAGLDLAAYRALGVEPDVSVVLAAPAGAVRRADVPGIEIRPVRTDADWAAATVAALEFHPPPDEHERRFVLRQVASRRAATEAGQGAWFGAFDGARMVAGLGIFRAGPGRARYASVDTAEGYRRRGIAGALLGAASAHARAEMDADQVVIVADPDYHAITLYRRIGFADRAKQVQLLREP